MSRLLYGVQATGNGHITRARALLPQLRAAGFEVDVLLSGREQRELFGLDDFGAVQVRTGLSFAMAQGRIQPVKTALQAKIGRLIRDVGELDLKPYDLVLCDFEPVTAWAAKRRGVPSVGIGHQYAFRQRVPMHGVNIPSRLVLRNFAPVDVPVGVHWHHFGAPILPPILEALPAPAPSDAQKVLVYLPFEATADLQQLLQPFSSHHFHIYCAISAPADHGHIHLRPFSREGFRRDLLDCSAIITGAGFELPSEALVLGKKLLVRPLSGQLEQESNALALQQLGAALVMHKLSADAVAQLLALPPPQPVHYPDVAAAFAHWLAAGQWQQLPALAQTLWQQTRGLPPAAGPHARLQSAPAAA